jgi:hypothetical protein
LPHDGGEDGQAAALRPEREAAPDSNARAAKEVRCLRAVRT